jgi:phosphoglycerate dehydrogenase-like enzyme
MMNVFALLALVWIVGGVQPPADPDSIGSTRNARIAIPIEDERKELVFLAGPMPPDLLSSLKTAAPNVRIISGLTRGTAMEHAAEAHGADARFVSPEFLAKATKLVWVQAMSAGVEHLTSNPAVASHENLVLTNMRAVHGPAIADHAMAMLLTLTRQLSHYLDVQKRGQWTDRDTPARPVALAGKTMLVVGIGGIGTEIAQRAHGFGMTVIATRRSATPAPDYVKKVGTPADLLSMLPEADVVAICVPLTDETRGLFNAAAFKAMKPGSYLINIARGRVVETPALIEALKSGKLAGACLDVTDPEPLPTGHALWSMPNVVITPHMSADSDLTDTRRTTLLIENIRRFGAGEPLLNCVDVKTGY